MCVGGVWLGNRPWSFSSILHSRPSPFPVALHLLWESNCSLSPFGSAGLFRWAARCLWCDGVWGVVCHHFWFAPSELEVLHAGPWDLEGPQGIWVPHFISNGPSLEGPAEPRRSLLTSSAQSWMPMSVDFSMTPTKMFLIFFFLWANFS